MNYWLFKSEPNSWSWQDQLKKGDKGEGWDGVRNYQASNNMKKMKLKDQGFFYHSVTEKKIVGIVEIIKEYEIDPTDKTKKFGMVTVKALKTLDKSVSLEDIKGNKKLTDFIMLRQNRLSVLPVSVKEWNIICKMAT
jgi:predicted RNA-binding protein with PUA-like domain